VLVIDNPVLEFMKIIQTSTEEEAKQWLANNLGRFDAKTRDKMLLAFHEDAQRRRDGSSGDDDEMSFEEFTHITGKLQQSFSPKTTSTPVPPKQNDRPTTTRYIASGKMKLGDIFRNRPTPKLTIGEAFANVVDSLQENLTSEDPSFRNGVSSIASHLGLQSKIDEVIAVGTVVVTYRPRIMNIKESQRQKIMDAIKAVLTANPNVDLVPIQDSLGIKIINVQRQAPPALPPRKGFFNG
jgi:hypothetical protein